MRQRKTGTKAMLAGATLLLVCPLLMSTAQARSAHLAAPPTRAISVAHNVHGHGAVAQAPGVTKVHTVAYSPHPTVASRGPHYVGRSGGISCVPFARLESGISVGGSAWQWWGNAGGTYARGAAPEPGAVLAFRANPRMRLGHVAVIARVINPREVLIDHANWPSAVMRGGVSQAIPVVDVSENNDWTAVRVGLGRTGEFGSVYPTYGFIYDRPDNGTIEAAHATPAAQVAELNPAPRDLRQTASTPVRHYDEVAEAPLHPRRHAVVIMPRRSNTR